MLFLHGQVFADLSIRDFDINLDKQPVQDMFAYDWEQLCAGDAHGYAESTVDGLLEFMQGSCKVLCEDNQVIGFVEYVIKSDNRAHVDCLGVHKDYRGKGFGIFLLQHALDDIAFWGIDYVTIDVIMKNSIARNLYINKFGFHPLYIKYYLDFESGQESSPVLCLGRAIDVSLRSSEIEQLIIATDEDSSEIEGYRMETFVETIKNMR